MQSLRLQNAFQGRGLSGRESAIFKFDHNAILTGSLQFPRFLVQPQRLFNRESVVFAAFSLHALVLLS
jgi:hypothetical protein